MTTINKDRIEKQFVHFMVDFETLGVIPNKNPVLQVAAVKFDSVEFEACKNEDGSIVAFEAFLPLADQIKLGRKPDAGTVAWWSKPDKKEVAEVVFKGVQEAPPLKEQLEKFANWVAAECRQPDGSYAESVFWAKPTLFDYPFMDGLFLETGVPSPFHFRKVMDMHSYIVSALKNVHYAVNHYQMNHHVATETYWYAFEKVRRLHKGRKDAHNASSDCIFQLDWLKEISSNLGHYVSETGIKETLARKD